MEVIKEIFEAIPPFIKEWGEIFISAAAFVFSVVAMKKASKSEELQDKVMNLNYRSSNMKLTK